MNIHRKAIADNQTLPSSLGALTDMQQEKKAITIVEKWRDDSAENGVKRLVARPGGTIQFLFCPTQPSIIHAVLQVRTSPCPVPTLPPDKPSR